MLEALVDSDVFDYYHQYNWWASLPISYDHARFLIVGMSCLWPDGKLENFSHTPVFRLFRHHSLKEREEILNLLEDLYGFNGDTRGDE